jgi:hypothetical protein
MRRFLICVFLTAPALVSAQPSDKTPALKDVRTMATDDCARARAAGKTCVLSIDDGDTVEGSAPTAGGSLISGIDFGTAASLVRIRRDLIAEILRSAEDLD